MNTKLKKVQKAYDNFVLPFQGDITDKDLELSLKRAKKLYQATIELYEDKAACLEAKKYLIKNTEPNYAYLDVICYVYDIADGLCGLYHSLHRKSKMASYFSVRLSYFVTPGNYYKSDEGPQNKNTRKKIIRSLELRVELIDKLLKLLK